MVMGRGGRERKKERKKGDERETGPTGVRHEDILGIGC